MKKFEPETLQAFVQEAHKLMLAGLKRFKRDDPELYHVVGRMVSEKRATICLLLNFDGCVISARAVGRDGNDLPFDAPLFQIEAKGDHDRPLELH